MAKRKPTIDANLFARTEEPQKEAEPAGPERGEYKTYGIGMYENEWKRLEEIAAEVGQTRHKLAQYAIRKFIRDYEAGDIETETRPKLPGLD